MYVCLSLVSLSRVFLGPVWVIDTRSGPAVEYNLTAGLRCPLRLLFWKGQTVILKRPCLYKQKTGSDDSGAAVWLHWESTRNRAGCRLNTIHYSQIHVLQYWLEVLCFNTSQIHVLYSQIHVLQYWLEVLCINTSQIHVLQYWPEVLCINTSQIHVLQYWLVLCINTSQIHVLQYWLEVLCINTS